MADLVKIQTTDNMEQVVSARELHEKLGILKRFSAWWDDQTSRLELKEGETYCTCGYTNANNQTFPDYLIPIDIAKHICMVSGGERAHIIRQYFILNAVTRLTITKAKLHERRSKLWKSDTSHQ